MSLKLNVIELIAADIPASLKFYALLDVAVPSDIACDDHVEAELGNGVKLTWDTVELIQQIDPHWVAPTGHRISLAFQCESPADVDAKFAEVTGAGFAGKSEPWDAFWGQRYAQVLDPDGNVIDIYAPLG